jgi:hypothetical protein
MQELQGDDNGGQGDQDAAGGDAEDRATIAEVPISVMQGVRVDLRIDPAKLSKEQLTDEPKTPSTSSSNEDK